MIRINLLPPQERHTNICLSPVIAAVSGLMLTVFAVLYGYGYYCEVSLTQKINETRNQFELLRPTQEKMLIAAQKQQQLGVKNNILIALTGERKSWHAILSHLGTITPEQVWLIELSNSDKNMLSIKGMAATYPDLAEFMQKLGQGNLFTDPVLIKAERDQGLAATRFEISVKVKGM